LNNRVPGIAYIRNSMYNRPDINEIGTIIPEHEKNDITGVEAATPSIPITERKVTEQSPPFKTLDRGLPSCNILPNNAIMIIVAAVVVLFLFKDNCY